MYTLKKSLGQQFLRDENISRKIVATVLDTRAFKETGDAPPLGDSPSGQLSESESCERVLNSVQNEVPGVRVLEVGPGAGALTKYLLEIEGLDFKAVELDEEKRLYLQQTWPLLQDNILHESNLHTTKPFEQTFTLSTHF